MAPTDEGSQQPRHATVQTFAGFWVVLAVGVSFALLLGLVAGRWAPLRSWDRAVAEATNAAVSGVPWLVSALHVVTDLGG